MPSIITKNGKISYKTYPLYPGVKRINKEIAAKNLILLKDILDKNNVHFVLFYGTLLGAVRNGDFIDHDEDIDLALLEEEKEKLFDCLPQIIDIGFSIARYDRKGLISVIRNGEYIDFYFFKKYKEGIVSCVGNLTFDSFLIDTIDFKFKNSIYQVPKEYIKYLEFEYGSNWETPIVYNNYNMSRCKIRLFELKEYFKESLPDKLYFLLSAKSEKTTERKYLEKIRNWTRK